MAVQRAIHFCFEQTRVHEIPTIDELSDEEYASSYYSPAEYLWINKRERKLLRRLKMVGDVGPDDDRLGLTSKSENREKHFFMDAAHAVVFNEIQRQEEENDDDPERLAEEYSLAAEENCNRAHLRAVALHKAVTTQTRRRQDRRWSMDMGRERTRNAQCSHGIAPPKRPMPATSLSENFDFAETLPPGAPAPVIMSPRNRRRSLKGMVMMPDVPVRVMQSPCKNRWSQEEKEDGRNSNNNCNNKDKKGPTTSALGIPKRMPSLTLQCPVRRKSNTVVYPQPPMALPLLNTR